MSEQGQEVGHLILSRGVSEAEPGSPLPSTPTKFYICSTTMANISPPPILANPCLAPVIAIQPYQSSCASKARPLSKVTVPLLVLFCHSPLSKTLANGGLILAIELASQRRLFTKGGSQS